MNRNLTDITLIVDRSGSMESIQSDAEGGINALIREQAEQEGNALITIVQFDTEYEFVIKAQPADQVKPYKLFPRGGTALLDAVGRAINETDQRMAAMSESDRPGLVVMVVMTDGLENSSVEFNRNKVKEMIEHHRSVNHWKFTFLGADQDAFAEAGQMGMAMGAAANFSKSKVGAAYRATSAKLGRMRHQVSQCEEVDDRFTESERDEMR